MMRLLAIAILAVSFLAPAPIAIAGGDPSEIAFWESVKDSTDGEELKAYLDAYPNGKFAPLAKIRLKKLSKNDLGPPRQLKSLDTSESQDDVELEAASERREIDLEVKLGATPGNPERGRLGVQIINLPKDAAVALEVSESGAVFINNVQKDTAAEAYGVAVGDIVVSVDGETTSNIQTLVNLIAARAPGEIAALKIVRLANSPVEFVQVIRREAEKLDNPGLNAFVASLYSSGLGAAAPADPGESFSWTRKAANQGHPASMTAVGNHYANVDKNPKEAINWYRKAADKGDAAAMDRLGSAYDSGSGVTKNYAEARRWYRKAAEAGNSSGMYNLGWKYHSGQGGGKDPAEAEKWFRKAADLGASGAMIMLGYFAEFGDNKNFAEAVKWYRNAADSGSWDGMVRLGRMYDNGRGVTKDRAQALQWFRKAADQGYNEAIQMVGDAYRFGNGTKADSSEALSWYRKAADNGYAPSMASVGLMYEIATGVEKDMAEALKWYRKANDTDKRYTWSRVRLAIVYDEGRGVDKDPRAAAEYLLNAYLLGDATAEKYLFRESKNWNRNTRRAVQEHLRDAGVYKGSIDGKLGPSSRRAIKALKAQNVAQAAANADSSSGSGTASTPAVNDDFGDLKSLDTLD